MSYTLTIAPLATPGHTTAAAWEAVKSAKHLYLQTVESPCAAPLLALDLPYTAMDDLYETTDDFDQLNAAIADRLCGPGLDAVYAVCGRRMAWSAAQPAACPPFWILITPFASRKWIPA